jgi:hypothetical protein
MAHTDPNFFYQGGEDVFSSLSLSLARSPFLSSLDCQSAAVSRVFMLDQF